MQINLDKRIADLRRRGVIVTANNENKTVDFAIADATLRALSNRKLNSVLAEVKKIVLLFVSIGYKVSANGQAVSFADCHLPILSEQPRGGFVDGKVTHIFEHEVTEWLNIDGIQVTHEHPFYVVGRGWVRAGDLKPGDTLFTDNGEYKPVEKVEQMTGKTKVYNLEVNDAHTYFAGGVLVHNKRAENAWAGGPLSGDGFTVVGDAPGGVWTPHTEVIYNGHVFNAEESRALRNAGLLEGATYAAGGIGGGHAIRNPRGRGGLGGGNQAQPGRGRNRPAGGRAGGPVGGVSSLGTSSATAGEETSADVVASQAADTAAAMVVSSQQSAQENAQLQTQQTVQATQESSAAVVEKLNEVAAILKKQADRNDLYALFHSGQQTNI